MWTNLSRKSAKGVVLLDLFKTRSHVNLNVIQGKTIVNYFMLKCKRATCTTRMLKSLCQPL